MRRVLTWLAVASASYAVADVALEKLVVSVRALVRPPEPVSLRYMDHAAPVIVYPEPAA